MNGIFLLIQNPITHLLGIKVVTITHKPSSFLGLLVKSRSILELVIKKSLPIKDRDWRGFVLKILIVNPSYFVSFSATIGVSYTQG